MKISNLESLLEFIKAGGKSSYLFFWRHTSKGAATVTKTCLSQWIPAQFFVEGKNFPTAEHFIMAKKAELFGDIAVFEKILAEPNPKEVKRFGREIRNFDEARWKCERERIVFEGNLAKFTQNPSMENFLLSTGEAILVEASPVDRIWGIGLAEENPDVFFPEKWKGLNLLGFALMKVRRHIYRENLRKAEDDSDGKNWDYSLVPGREWVYDVRDDGDDSTTMGCGDKQYTVVEIRKDGIHHYFFNDTANVATWGGHGGVSIDFEKFLALKPGEISAPDYLVQEVKEWLIKHRKRKLR